MHHFGLQCLTELTFKNRVLYSIARSFVLRHGQEPCGLLSCGATMGWGRSGSLPADVFQLSQGRLAFKCRTCRIWWGFRWGSLFLSSFTLALFVMLFNVEAIISRYFYFFYFFPMIHDGICITCWYIIECVMYVCMHVSICLHMYYISFIQTLVEPLLFLSIPWFFTKGSWWETFAMMWCFLPQSIIIWHLIWH